MISVIVAVSKNGVIGNKNKLPWHLSEDLKRFKRITTNNTIVMGFNTFKSIGKPLPNRKNIIITRKPIAVLNEDYKDFENLVFFNSIEDFLNSSKEEKIKFGDIFIIGGSDIYKQFIKLNLIDKVYLTLIEEEFKGDAFFDLTFLKEQNFKITEEIECYDETSKINYKFQTFLKN